MFTHSIIEHEEMLHRHSWYVGQYIPSLLYMKVVLNLQHTLPLT